MKTNQATAEKTTRNARNEKALQAFCINIADARELVTLIGRHLDEHMEVGPDEVNWAHVGDAGRIRESLKEIAATFNLIGEVK